MEKFFHHNIWKMQYAQIIKKLGVPKDYCLFGMWGSNLALKDSILYCARRVPTRLCDMHFVWTYINYMQYSGGGSLGGFLREGQKLPQMKEEIKHIYFTYIIFVFLRMPHPSKSMPNEDIISYLVIFAPIN